MKKKARIIGMMLLALSLFTSGCAGVSKEAQVKCPKCGAVFKIHEGRFTGGDKQ
jgi:hypothetical protein